MHYEQDSSDFQIPWSMVRNGFERKNGKIYASVAGNVT